MTEAEFQQHLDAAEKSPKEIAAAVIGLPDKVLRYKPAPDKWCVLEILAHLADMEIVLRYRMRQMLADSKPVIAPIDQDAWARNLGYMEVPVPELIAFFGIARHNNLRLLKRVTPGDYGKSAYHPELQREMTIGEIAERIGVHGANHLQQIERLKKVAGGK